MNDSLVVIVVFFIVLPVIIVCIGVSVEARKRRDLDLHGRTVTATITNIHGNDLDGYSATAEWRNPRTGTIDSFEGNGSSYRVGESVEVIFDPYNPRKCYFRRVTTEDYLRQEQAYQDALKERDRYRMM